MSPRKVDSPRKRMREVLHRGPKNPPISFRIEMPDDAWFREARIALTTGPLRKIYFAGGRTVLAPDDFVDYSARSVRKLFDHFKLDPQQPLHWRWLVNLFAYAEFWEGPKRKVGAPKRADEHELATALATLPSCSDAEAARRLARKFAKGSSTSGLRRRIAKVRAKAKAGS